LTNAGGIVHERRHELLADLLPLVWRRTKTPANKGSPMPDHESESYTVSTFCAAEHISRAMLYKLWSQGQGPRYYMVGNRRRITHQARIEWQRECSRAA
jgi:hypothetical protein